MTGQIPDEVRHGRFSYAITAVDGAGLFDPADHGLAPHFLSTACWRGYHCRYQVTAGRLLLDRVAIGLAPEQSGVELFGKRASPRGDRAFTGLAAPMPFTGRLLLGDDWAYDGYLNMGFAPAWVYARVLELVLEQGRVTAAHDRSAELADVRDRLGDQLSRPRPGRPREEWVQRTFSLAYDYSWPASA